ncbi:MAG TPA: sigma-70 family RNA polymerase sigma factor [Candidatus Paceibacterota bacterium]|nr:sigma-70 family RNA polymerase sigma factor [Candidatus Paceibacterota bacterium]HSA00487.1 sigma-70 family RNA polymerase sigma factor [Candidatus Paceibacterota bacterium]
MLAAGNSESPPAAEALEQLCRTYWYPLYAYVRRRGYSVEDAQDLTQEFFARVMKKGSFGLANPARGKFRTFLLHSLQNFLANDWKSAQRLKRGGGTPCLSLDVADAERRYANEPAAMLTPERAYEKRWALTLLEGVLVNLQQEYAQAGNGRVFEELADLLWGKDTSRSYAHIGEHLGMTEGATRGAMHRLRERFRERLRAEVAQTVADFREVDDELRHLIAVVGRRA